MGRRRRHRIAFQRCKDHVPHFRMHQPVDHPAVCHEAAANTRAHRHIQQAAAPLARAHRVFRQRRRVHIRVDARRHTQRILERRHQWIIDPLFFRRFGDVAVSRRSRIQVKRAERADSQRLDVEFPDKIHNLRHGHIRRERLKTGALEHAALRITDRADHFGAARFQCANKHKPSSFLRPAWFPPFAGRLSHVRVCVHDTLTARMCQMILSDIFSFRSEEDAPWPILPCFPATRGC